jgi:transcriptional regulator with XRE-family HTH domain
MDTEKLKLQIGANISSYRKKNGLTQAGLAERLNYSDKAISKWERGESVPDVMTLVQLAEQFETSVNELITDPNALPEDTSGVQQAMGKVVEKTLRRKASKSIILGLSSILVWFVALLIYVVLGSFGWEQSALAFLYAIPANAIVALSLRSAWHDFRWNKAYISALIWGVLISLHMTVLVLWKVNLWRIYLLGIPGQAAIFLWFRMFRSKNEEKEHGQDHSAPPNP